MMKPIQLILFTLCFFSLSANALLPAPDGYVPGTLYRPSLQKETEYMIPVKHVALTTDHAYKVTVAGTPYYDLYIKYNLNTNNPKQFKRVICDIDQNYKTYFEYTYGTKHYEYLVSPHNDRDEVVFITPSEQNGSDTQTMTGTDSNGYATTYHIDVIESQGEFIIHTVQKDVIWLPFLDRYSNKSRMNVTCYYLIPENPQSP